MTLRFAVINCLVLCFISSICCFKERVRLTDVQVLTLKHGQSTAGRRSSPVPQLKCVGGTANGKFTPKVVQCYNRGFDGNDVQWECKTDMDNDYRFGDISVSCEGYDFPEDPYILQGSCGLEYTLDYTKQGYAQSQKSSHNYGYEEEYTGYYSTKSHHGGSSLANIFPLLIVGLIVYAVYKTCISNENRDGDFGDGARRDGGGGGYPGGGGGPPPPGFRNDPPPYDDASCNNTRYRGAGTSNMGGGLGGGVNGANGPGFWTGMGAGGLLGYLFGGRNNAGYGGGYNRGGFNRGWGGGNAWGAPSFGGGGGGGGYRTGGGGGGGGGGTRTASGFGGTTRR